MTRRPAAFAAALLAATTLAATVQAACTNPAEMKAVQYRQLQTDLMVAWLKCRNYHAEFDAKYKAYMDRAGPGMSENANQLRAMLQRHGKGAGYLDRYLTQMSNDAQLRSQGQENYCEGYGEAMDKLATMRVPEIQAYAASTIPAPYGATACAAPKPPVKQVKTKEPAKGPVKKAEAKG